MQTIAARARIAGLTPQQALALSRLNLQRNKRATPHAYGEVELGWCRPVDIGSPRLRDLVRRGFVDCKSYAAPGNRAGEAYSRVYRISESGVSAYELYAEHMAELSAAKYWHRERVQHRDRLAVEREASALVP